MSCSLAKDCPLHTFGPIYCIGSKFTCMSAQPGVSFIRIYSWSVDHEKHSVKCYEGKKTLHYTLPKERAPPFFERLVRWVLCPWALLCETIVHVVPKKVSIYSNGSGKMKSGGVVRSTCKEGRRSLCFSLFLTSPPVLSKLERETRYWPMVYADTLTFTLAQVLSITGLKGQRSYDSHSKSLAYISGS